MKSTTNTRELSAPPERKPVRRARARLGVIATLGITLLGASGCSYLAPQQTTVTYAASDGIQANLGAIEVRNILIVSAASGEPGRLVGSVVNTSDQNTTVTFTLASGVSTEVPVAARAVASLNLQNAPVIFSSVAEPPGALVPTTISTSLGEQSTEDVPVLDGTLEEYRPYVPTPPSNPAPQPTSEPEASTPATIPGSPDVDTTPSEPSEN